MAPSHRNRACIVLSTHKGDLERHEEIALTRLAQVYPEHPLVLVKPDGVDDGAIRRLCPWLRTEIFPDRFFGTIRAYNALMLNRGLYERFADYDFMLIYHFDAFVFRDELDDWCGRGYDYIGAPWLTPKHFRSAYDQKRLLLKRQLYRLLDVRNPHFPEMPHPVRMHFSVGNGGFSLRRVAAFLRVLDDFRQEVADLLAHERCLNEDLFYALVVNRLRQHLRVPDFRQASRFAVECYPRECIEHLNGGALPFGCHAWHKFDPDFWRPIFARLQFAI